jgi:putative ABC transport system permease protein
MLIALAIAELACRGSRPSSRRSQMQYWGPNGILLPVAPAVDIAVGLAGGLYPAFYLSRYQPGDGC